MTKESRRVKKGYKQISLARTGLRVTEELKRAIGKSRMLRVTEEPKRATDKSRIFAALLMVRG